jgi:hypothetical protein
MKMNSNPEDSELDAPIKSFSHRGWDVRIYLSKVSQDTYVGHVDIFEGQTKRCRIVLAGPLNEFQAVSTLETRSADWVDDWLSRPHTGDTDFSAL